MALHNPRVDDNRPVTTGAVARTAKNAGDALPGPA